MANTKISVLARNAAVNGVAGLLNAGTGPGYIEVRSGVQPADPDTAASGILLARLVLSDPAFAAAASGTATANAITADSAADNTGTATWFRAYDSDAFPVLDGDVSGTGGGGDLQLSNTSITVGGEVSVSSWTITMPGA